MARTRQATVLVAPNAFKGTLTSSQAAYAIQRGIRQIFPHWATILFPMADGGSGSIDALVTVHGGTVHGVRASNPLGKKIMVRWGLLADGKTGVVEMAEASGLKHLSPATRNPLKTSSFGTGEILRHVARQGVQEILLCMGDTATVDGGAGLLQALGARLSTASGKPIAPGNTGLAELEQIDLSRLEPALAQVKLTIACDVTNPLLGPTGAAAVFGPQKGARPEEVPLLERNLARLESCVQRCFGKSITTQPGSGAAGGAGGTLAVLLGAHIVSGGSLFTNHPKFQEALAQADFVITGEGCLDEQTLGGKGPFAVAQAARQHHLPVCAFAGHLHGPLARFKEAGFTAVFQVGAKKAPEMALTATVADVLRTKGEFFT
ncbi:MAG: glycerate kinase [Blastocatellia bacterium]|nr:glycerate kinase [Blastocatellia bacterium]